MDTHSDESSTWTNREYVSEKSINAIVPEGYEIISVKKEHAITLQLDADVWGRAFTGAWVSLSNCDIRDFVTSAWIFGILVKKDSET